MDKEVDSPEEGDEWLEKPEFLMPRFNTIHTLVQKQVEYNDMDAARQNYQRLLRLYDEINMSRLSASEKQAAYRRLMEVFSTLSSPDSSPKSSILSVGKYLFPISLVLIVIIIVIFARPEFSMTGLAVLGIGGNSAPEWIGISPEFDIIGKTTINLDTYFRDANWDNLEYSVTSAPNLEITVEDNLLTIVPEYGIQGTRIVHIVASDGEESARQTVTLNIH